MRGAVIVLLALNILAPVGTALAESVESLQGAWTLVGTSCADTFEFSAGGEPKFKDRGSSLNTGVIIRGDRIVGPSSTCTASHIRENQGQYIVHMSCDDAIMFSSVTVTLKIVDPQHFDRIDPDFSEDNYQKCLPGQ